MIYQANNVKEKCLLHRLKTNIGYVTEDSLAFLILLPLTPES